MSISTIVLLVVGIVLGLAIGSKVIFLLQRVVVAMTQVGLFVGLIVGLCWLLALSRQPVATPTPVEPPAPAFVGSAEPTFSGNHGPVKQIKPVPAASVWWKAEDSKTQ